MDRKKIIPIALAALLVVGGAGGAVAYNRRAAELERLGRERVVEAYWKVNFAFRRVGTGYDIDMYTFGYYRPMVRGEDGESTFYPNAYIALKMYERDTGITLPYETVVDYFSEEFEPDGSLRLYDNGLHPEVEAYVDWAWTLRQEQMGPEGSKHGIFNLDAWDDCDHALVVIHLDYAKGHAEEGYEHRIIDELSPQVIDELVKKEADPSYEMDLLSLQQQGH